MWPFRKNDTSALEADQLRELMKADRSLTLVDVRTAGEYRTEHLTPCLNLDLMRADEFGKQLSYYDKQATYCVYCARGPRSRKALKRMRKMGFEHVFWLKGGMGTWTGPKRLR